MTAKGSAVFQQLTTTARATQLRGSRRKQRVLWNGLWTRPRPYRTRYPIDTLRENLPAIVRTSAIWRPVKLPDDSEVMSGENVIIRPIGPGVAFVQLDDLKNSERIDRVRPRRFIIHETAPATGRLRFWCRFRSLEGQRAVFLRNPRAASDGHRRHDKSPPMQPDSPAPRELESQEACPILRPPRFSDHI